MARRSKEELIALVQEMLKREPDLESLLELPLPGGPRPAEVSPEAFRRQAVAAFGRGGYEWGAARAIADDLSVLVENADAFLEQEDLDAAAAAYRGILAGVLEHFGTVHDEPGDLHEVVGECVEGMAKCLKAFEGDPARREPLLRAVFEVHALDMQLGGVGLSDTADDPLEDLAPEEEGRLKEWIREKIPGATGWQRESLESWLLNLEADSLDDETYLRRARELGHPHRVVGRLLQLGRVEEAVAEAGNAKGYELVHLADLLVSHRQGEQAERLVRQHLSKDGGQDWHLLEWLKKRATARKDTAALLELTEREFRQAPSLQSYKQLRQLAGKEDRWEALRPRLLELVKKHPYHSSLLVEIALDEGDLDEALKLVKGKRPVGFGYGGVDDPDPVLQVARAAEKTRPRAALEIYRERAEAAIAGRNRSAYQQACGLLKKVRALHKELGEEDVWAKYVAGLRQKHPTLRAFQEELTRAKL